MLALTREQETDVAGLGVSLVQVASPMLTVRAAHWRNGLARVGVPAPFWCVHDIGLALVADVTALAPRRSVAALLGDEVRGLLEAWSKILREIAATEAAERSRAWKLPDPLVVVVLLRVIGPLYERYLGPGRRPIAAPLPIDPELYETLDERLPELFQRAADHATNLAFLRHLVAEGVRLVTAIELIDLDTLRLLGMLGAEASAANALSAMDLLNVLESPEANDVVNFSLDLLPAVLETKRATGAQTFASDGYAGLAQRGSIDSLVLSELAHEEDLFDQRFAENQVFYYAREKQREDEGRCHYICIDATASMRGQRSVFARGLALTLLKKLQLRGEDVFFRFFDARLYDEQFVSARRSSQALDIPYILSFKGERGRNYAKVFGLLASELARVAKREKRSVVLYLVTHAECHIPLETVEALRAHAQLYGIFMLPSSGELDLEYLSRLHRVQVITHAALSERDARAKRAMDIVDDAAGEARPGGDGERRSSIPPSRRRAAEGHGEAEDLASARELAEAEREVDALVGGSP